jgi:hypothetical protein
MSKELYFTYELSSDTIMSIIMKKCHTEGDVLGALKLCKEFINNNQWNDDKTTSVAYDILNGKAVIVGTYPQDDYGVEYFDKNKDKKLINETIINLKNELEDTQEKLEELRKKYCFICENLSETNRNQLQKDYQLTYNEKLFDKYVITEDLQDFLDLRNSEDSENEYGWLEPNGEFHPVEWCKHGEWAREYLNEHYPFLEFPELYYKEESFNTRKHIVNGDVLIYKLNWVLIHNPQQGKGQITKNPLTRFTKEQKEFLYDYFMKRERKQEANSLYKED